MRFLLATIFLCASWSVQGQPWTWSSVPFLQMQAPPATAATLITNQASIYMTGIGQSGSLTTANVASGSYSSLTSDWLCTPSPATAFKWTTTPSYKLNHWLRLQNGNTYDSSTASVLISEDMSVALTHIDRELPNCRQATFASYLTVNLTNGSYGSPFDVVRFDGASGSLLVLQIVADPTLRFRLENTYGGTTTSNVCNLTTATTYKIVLTTDYTRGTNAVWVYNQSDSSLVASTPFTNSTAEDLVQVLFGNDASGVQARTNFWGDPVYHTNIVTASMLPWSP